MMIESGTRFGPAGLRAPTLAHAPLGAEARVACPVLKTPPMPHSLPASFRRYVQRTRAWAGVLAFVAAGTLAACEPEVGAAGTDPFIAALPTAELVAIGMPGRAAEEPAQTTEALAVEEAALVGHASQLEEVTFGVEVLVRNVMRDVLLDFSRAIHTAPRIKTDARRVWFFNPGGGPTQDLIVMERTDDGDFRVSIWLREIGPLQPKTWRFLAAAIVTPSADHDGNARGTVWVDLEADRWPRTRGAIRLSWTHQGGVRDTEIALYGASPDDTSQTPVSRSIRFHRERPGGYLAFDAGQIDIHQDGAHPAKEAVKIFTRWNGLGHLRADFTAVGPDIAAAKYRALIGSECWVAADRLVLFERRAAVPLDSDKVQTLWEDGDAEACPFGLEKPPILPEVGPPPTAPTPPPETDPSFEWGS